MNYFIDVEDLVANALIELVEKTGNRTVSFSQLNKYGDAIIAKLRARNLDATLIYTRDKTEQFFHDYSDIFTINESESDIEITLNDNISTAYLRKKFRINLAVHLLSAFVSPEAVKTITTIWSKVYMMKIP